MKRVESECYLRLNNCILLCEGAKHSVWSNTSSEKQATLPRYTELLTFFVYKICKELGILKPKR